MSARILVVDDVAANVKLLEAKLKAEYYTVLTAMNGFDALKIAREEQPDLVLLDVMMPKMDGFEVCRRLKADPETAHIPVVMVTALDQPSDRVRGLEVGADDFLTKPPNQLALLARVRSLVRVKMMIDELRMRDETSRSLGLDAPWLDTNARRFEGRVVVVDERGPLFETVRPALTERIGLNCLRASGREEALEAARAAETDLFLIDAAMLHTEALRLCSELRSAPDTRHTALLLIVDDRDYETIAKALDLGANDYVMRPVDEHELIARSLSQIRRKRFSERLRDNMAAGLRMAATDPMTGLYNRRYAGVHLATLMRRGEVEKAPLAALLLDIDRFKSINDRFGHAAGDSVIVEVARRMREKIRNLDLAARIGGEEFLVVMPGASEEEGMRVAERLRDAMAASPFMVTRNDGAALEIEVTISVGVSETRAGLHDAPEDLLRRADSALYESKRMGRNRVTCAAA